MKSGIATAYSPGSKPSGRTNMLQMRKMTTRRFVYNAVWRCNFCCKRTVTLALMYCFSAKQLASNASGFSSFLINDLSLYRTRRGAFEMYLQQEKSAFVRSFYYDERYNQSAIITLLLIAVNVGSYLWALMFNSNYNRTLHLSDDFENVY